MKFNSVPLAAPPASPSLFSSSSHVAAAFVICHLHPDALAEVKQQLQLFAMTTALTETREGRGSLPLSQISTCIAALDDKVRVVSSLRPFNLRELHTAASLLSASVPSSQLITRGEASAPALLAFLGYFFPHCPPGSSKLAYLLCHATTQPDTWRPALELTRREQGRLVFLCIDTPTEIPPLDSADSRDPSAPPPTSDSDDLRRFLQREFPDCSECVHLPFSPAGLEGLRHRWLREVALAGRLCPSVTLAFPGPVLPHVQAHGLAPDPPSFTSNGTASDLSVLRLEAVTEALPLALRVEPCACCSCHGALLDLAPSPTPALGPSGHGHHSHCPVTGRPLPPGACKQDSSVLRLSESTLLHFPPASPAPEALLASVGSSKGSQVEFRVVERVDRSSLSLNQLLGSPFVLRIPPGQLEPASPTQHGVPEGVRGDPPPGVGAVPGTVKQLQALVRALDTTSTALLASSRADMETGRLSAWPLYYVLLPDAEKGVLVGRRTVALEEGLSFDLAGQQSGAELATEEERAEVAVLEFSAQAALNDVLPSRPFSLARTQLGFVRPLEQVLKSTTAPPKPTPQLGAAARGGPQAGRGGLQVEGGSVAPQYGHGAGAPGPLPQPAMGPPPGPHHVQQRGPWTQGPQGYGTGGYAPPQMPQQQPSQYQPQQAPTVHAGRWSPSPMMPGPGGYQGGPAAAGNHGNPGWGQPQQQGWDGRGGWGPGGGAGGNVEGRGPGGPGGRKSRR